jgi:hypothetical protein
MNPCDHIRVTKRDSNDALLTRVWLIATCTCTCTCTPRKEPRHGKRLTLAATAATNQGPLLIYCVHLEVPQLTLSCCSPRAPTYAFVSTVPAHVNDSHTAFHTQTVRRCLFLGPHINVVSGLFEVVQPRGRGCTALLHAVVVCCTLQVFCGMLARMRQFADIMAHVKATDVSKGPKHQVCVCGGVQENK